MKAFLTNAVRSYRTTGAVFPSSRRLASALTTSIRGHRGPKRVLEVGPGTGAVTKSILEALKPGDELHLVEINDGFAKHLEGHVLEPYRRKHPDVDVMLHVASIEDAPLDGPFNYIVCGIPFNNFPLSVVSLIFRRMISLLADDGELTYFEYVGMRTMKWLWVGKSGRQRIRRRLAMNKVLERRYRGHRDVIFRNFSPARAIHLHGVNGSGTNRAHR